VAGLSLLSARLVQIQLVDRQHYATSSRKAYHSTEKLPATRGTIVDRRDEPLARSVPVASLFVDKSFLNNHELAALGLAYQQASETEQWRELNDDKKKQYIRKFRADIIRKESPEIIKQKYLAYAVSILAQPLNMERNELREKILNTKASWFPIVKNLPADIADQLREVVDSHWLQGFEFENSSKRWYAAPDLATHLTGFIGEVEKKDESGKAYPEMIGRFGVESAMNHFLTGRDGMRERYRDASGLVIPGNAASLSPPRAGLNVRLTIDMGIQAIVEEELDAGLAQFQSNRGAVVLMDPKTGEILALASRPHFNLNDRKDIIANGYNYAIQAIYEPGSTIKIVATSGALNDGLVSPQSSIFCHNGHYQSGKVSVTDEHPAGSLSFEGVLQKSNNIGTYSIARQLGSKRFYDYLQSYGFGRKTGILLSGESSGLARNTGNEVDFSRACYGYATSVTPLQLACAYSVIAGDGNLRKPHIVKAIIANDGTVVEDYTPEIVNEVLKPKAAAQMRAALEKVTQEGGTAKLAGVQGFRVAGKTGTVQKHRENGGYMAGHYIVSFAGMMPAQDPAFVCIVVVDDPRITGMHIYGGLIAGPIFSKIATRTAAYMNLQPTESIISITSTAAR
jgi:cell division protein FtsI/penicillin-binding protein 2